MFPKSLIAPLFIAAGVVAHPHLSRRGDVSLSQWQSQNLESFWTFRNRYKALGCADQKDTDFYTTCCYPLGASESLSGRPAECTPTTSACDAPTVTTNTVTETDDYEDDDSDLPYCVDGQGEYDDPPSSTPSSSSQDSTYTPPADTYQDNNYTPPASSQDSGYTPPADSSSDNSQPAPTQDSNTNTGSADNNTSGDNTGGFATYFYQNGNAGACGSYHADSDLIGAIDHERYGDNYGVQSGLCGKSVHITNTNNGRSVDIIIADVCPTCANGNSIDLSEGAFKAIADLSDGMVPISWHFN